MKKLFLVILVFCSLFVIKSIHADSAAAAAGVISGIFSNSEGVIAVKVTPIFKRADNNTLACATTTITVTAGQSGTATCVDSSGNDNAPYTLSSWINSCGDSGNATTTGSAGVYTFTTQNAHCTNTNSTITITDTKCTDTTGTVTWRLNVNNDGTAPNIKTPFKVYKSLTSPAEFDTSPGTLAYVPLPLPSVATSYTLTPITITTTGNYYVAVKSFTPDNKSYTASGLLVCAGSMIPPTNFVAVTSCTGTTPVVAFTWTGAGPAGTYTFAYTVETNLNTDPGGGSWMGPPSTPTPSSNTYVNTTTLTAAQTYYAHVKAVATPVSTPANLFSAASVQFTVPTCAVSSATPPVFPASNDVITCASTTDNGDLTDNSTDNYQNAVPDRAKVTWTRATQSGTTANIAQEKLQYTTDSNFGTYSEIDHSIFTSVVTPNPDTLITSGSVRMHIVSGLNANLTYYFRVKTQMQDNSWVSSEIRSFRSPNNCFDSSLPVAPPTQHGIYSSIYAPNKNGFTRPGYGYCIGTQPYVRLGWVINKQNLINNPTSGFVVTRWWSDPFYASSMNLSWSGPVTGVVVVDNWFVAGLGVDSNFGVAYDIIPTCTSSPAAPSNLSTPQMSCDFVLLQFKDNATNETGFNVEISSDPFTSDISTTRSPSQWGVKTFSSGSPGATGEIWSWYWTSNTSYPSPPFSALTSGNANPQAPPGKELVPLEGVTYYWRVRANGTGTNSIYKYDDGTAASSVYPAGRSFTMPYCSPRSDLSANIDGGSWKDHLGNKSQTFTVNENVSVDIIITNEPVTGGYQSPPTKLYFYYKGAGTGGEAMPDCSANPQVPKTTIPVDGAPGAIPPLIQYYNVKSLAQGESTKINVKFNTGLTQAGPTGYGYVVPDCVLTGSKDPNFVNNKTGGFGYTVGVAKFFETQGGDVGAKGTISVGVPNPPNPYNISDYLIAGNDSVSGSISGLKVNSTTGKKLSGYLKNQVLGGGGVYKYFADRFLAKAKLNSDPNSYGCNIQTRNYSDFPNYLYYCAGDVNINASTIITGTPVFFIDGDLNINANLTVAVGSKAVYIVKGGVKKGINVATSVTTLQGIFISRQGFMDGDNGGEIQAVPISDGQLTITGALYVDGEDGGQLQLVRHWGGVYYSFNGSYPSDIFIFDPGYMVALGTILSSPSVGWKEVSP